MSVQEKAKLVSNAEIKNLLKKIEKERGELIYEQRIALDHAQAFSKLSVKQTKELIDELLKIESVEEFHAYKIADLLPKDEEGVKAIFAKERTNPGENEIKKILEIVNKFYIE
ncbi:MAG: RNA polymerase Rpb4 family protein [Thermoplasmatota archaeon]